MKTINMTINLEYLRDKGACAEGLEHFRAIFGSADVEVTVDNCRKVDVEYRDWFVRTYGFSRSVCSYFDAIDSADGVSRSEAPIEIELELEREAEAFVKFWKEYEKD